MIFSDYILLYSKGSPLVHPVKEGKGEIVIVVMLKDGWKENGQHLFVTKGIAMQDRKTTNAREKITDTI